MAPIRVHVVDPSSFTRPYDHALCSALVRLGASVDLITSAFAYDLAPAPDGYAVRELFYRHAFGAPGSRIRGVSKLAEHVPAMVRYRRAARAADVIHFQWLPVQRVDAHLLPRGPLVLTAHDLLPREPRPGQEQGQRRLYSAVDAVVVHSDYGRRELVERLGVDAEKVNVIHHGAFEHLVRPGAGLPGELARVTRPVVLFFGLLRSYKGLGTLLEAWREIDDAELWVVGRPRVALEPLRAAAPAGVRFVPRFVSDAELPAYFRRADLVVLPYSHTERIDFSGVLATALAFGRPLVLSEVGSFGEIAAAGAARLVPPDDVGALRATLTELIDDSAAREQLAAGARAAAAGPYSWAAAASKTLELYGRLAAT